MNLTNAGKNEECYPPGALADSALSLDKSDSRSREVIEGEFAFIRDIELPYGGDSRLSENSRGNGYVCIIASALTVTPTASAGTIASWRFPPPTVVQERYRAWVDFVGPRPWKFYSIN